MLAFILEVSIYWLVFYLVYFFFLRKETFFRFNRYYLLGALTTGLILPFMPISWISEDPVVVASVEFLGPVTQVPAYFKTIPAEDVTTWHWQDALLLLYWAGVVLFAGRLIYGLGRVLNMYRQGEKTYFRNHVLVEMSDAHLPFSFFHWVFWPKSADHLEVEHEFILKHELSHVQDRHSWDVLLLEMLQVFLWCSPLVYLYRRSLRAIHEYLADRSVLKTTHVKIYGHTLLRQSTSGLQVALANHFINSQLKNRITMMIRQPSGWAARFKLLYVLPALLLIALLVAAKSGPNGSNFNPDDSRQSIEARENYGLPLYVIFYANGEVSKTREFDSREIKPTDIDKINVLKGQQAVDKYGENAGDGVIEIYLKKSSQLSPPQPAPQIEEAFKVVEENPRFPGCVTGTPSDREECSKQKLLEYLYNNIHYPEVARQAGIEGMVVVRFIVEKDGSLSNIEAVRDVGGGTAEEAVRIVNKMNEDGLHWDAGRQRGQRVRVVYNLPVRFKLGDQAKAAPEVQEIYKGKDLDRPPLYGSCDNAGDLATMQSCSQALLMKKVYESITYPSDARADQWSGLVTVSYLVGTDGKAHLEYLYGEQTPASIREDVSRVVESLDQWKPAIKDGEPVNVRQSMTIEYRLESNRLKENEFQTTIPADFVVVGYPLNTENAIEPDKGIAIQADEGILLKNLDKMPADQLVIVFQSAKIVGKYDSKSVQSLPYQPDDIQRVNVLQGKVAKSKYDRENVLEIYLKNDVKIDISPKPKARELFKVVEENPRFPGCEDQASDLEREGCSKEKLLNYVYEHVKYPELARKNGIEGMVVVRFVIEKDGSINDLEIIRYIGGGCGEAALAVFLGMQKEGLHWIPGKQRGQNVAVQYNMPVRFKLTDEKKVVPPAIANQDYLALPDFKAFPNPTSDQVEISFSAPLAPVDVILYDIEMKVVWSKSMPKFNGYFNETIGLKGEKVAPGILILVVRQNGLSFTKQIILQ